MPGKLSLILYVTFWMTPLLVVMGYESPGDRRNLPPSRTAPETKGCVQADIPDALQKLSSGNRADVEQARKTLLEYSKRSATCRTEVIGALVNSMARADTTADLDPSGLNLWSEGARLLGEMKAVESLDLLISRLDLNDGEFSTSMVHQPAVLGLMKMGPVAIPKLRAALLSNSNPKIRLAAALCLTAIGGQPALDALREASRAETDQCVGDFVRVSLRTFGYDSKSRRRISKPTSFSAELNVRQELLTTFMKCN